MSAEGIVVPASRPKAQRARPSADLDYDVGIDVESPSRFAAMADGAVRALFHPEELAAAERSIDVARSLARIWCVKEASVKALWRWIQLDPRRVVVTSVDDDRPAVRIVGWDPRRHGVSMHVTVSDLPTVVVAWLIAHGSAPGSRSEERAKGERP